MRAIVLAIMLLVAGAAVTEPAMAQDVGMITRPSRYGFEETLTRLEASIRQTEFRLFGRIDHAAAARDVGLTMPPTVVVVFGNPRVGTPEFLRYPSMAIDFPLRALVRQDAEGRVSVGYNSAEYVYRTLYPRHNANVVSDDTVRTLAAALAIIVARAVE